MKSTLSITSRQLMLRELHDYLMIALGMLFMLLGGQFFFCPTTLLPEGCRVLLLLCIGLPD